MRRGETLIVGPYAGRRKLDEMIVRIAKIDTFTAERPLDAALDGNAGFAETLFPCRKFARRNGEGKMQVTAPAVRRDHTAGQLHGFHGAVAAKQDQDAMPANVEGAEAFVGSKAWEAKKALVKSC